MSLLVALGLAVAGAGFARVETVSLANLDTSPAVHVRCSSEPGLVVVHRDGDVARVTLGDTQLGLGFSGARRFEWTRAALAEDPVLRSIAYPIEVLRIDAQARDVHLYLRVPAEVPIRTSRRGVLVAIEFSAPREPALPPVIEAAVRPPEPAPALEPEVGVAETKTPEVVPAAEPEVSVAEAKAPEPVPAMEPEVRVAETKTPEVVPAAEPAFPPVIEAVARPPEVVPAGEPEAPAVAELYAQLFSSEEGRRAEPTDTPAGAAQAGEISTASLSIEQLYSRLFPSEPVVVEPTVSAREDTREEDMEGTFSLGFLRVRPSLGVAYVNADATVLDTPEPVREQYLQVQPRLNSTGVLWDGRLTADYEPVFRGLGTIDVVNTTSHIARANLQLQPGDRLHLGASGRYFTGTLETELVDPGREYFFDLGRFTRQDYQVETRFEVGPRLSLELGGRYGQVRFKEPSSFFDYDSQGARAGLGYELTPNLRATLDYTFSRVPTPEERPEAESEAHSGELSLSGDILPLLTGELTVGYRDQRSPNAGEGGRRFRGLTASGELTKRISRASSLTLRLDRATPPSAFEQNAFYVTTGLQGTLSVPLPLALRLTSGAGYRWNDYRTPASELGVPREDRIFGWFVGLRRVLWGRAYLSADYRRERRDSNLSVFETVTEGFALRLDLNLFDAWTEQ